MTNNLADIEFQALTKQRTYFDDFTPFAQKIGQVDAAFFLFLLSKLWGNRTAGKATLWNARLRAAAIYHQINRELFEGEFVDASPCRHADSCVVPDVFRPCARPK
jgi:hypothetical protein